MKRGVFLGIAGFVSAAGSRALANAMEPMPAGPISLTVYHVRNNVMTDIAIAPQRLATYPGVAVRVVHDPAAISAALAAVKAAEPHPDPKARHDVDCRWGLVFAHADGRRHTVYTDSFGVRAIIDGKRHTFAAVSLASWLAKHYGPA